MPRENSAQENAPVVGIRIKSIKRAGLADVYCLAGARNGTMIANGIITRNCDALRYVIATHKVASYSQQEQMPGNQEYFKNRFQPTRRF